MARASGGSAREGEAAERRRLVHRLARVEGQVAALRQRLEGEGITVDLLVQVAAVRGALSQFTARALGEYVAGAAGSGAADDARRREDLSRVLSSLLRQS